MPPYLSRLRHWFAGAAIAAVLLVAGMYFYAQHRVQNALKQVPEKIGLEIQQSATGFTVSKSEQGRTLFKIQASKVVQFKAGGRAELHDVQITLYGRDSSRFDQIYGDDFEYDQQSGDVTAIGEVQIDLEANPQGLLSPDQAPPGELKNPIHLKTSGLVFNQKTGNASTKEKIGFSLPQGSGSALGAHYVAKTNAFTLDSQVSLTFTKPAAATIIAARGTITRDPRWVVLEHPHLQNGDEQCDADQATLFLRNDNTLDRAVAHGNVLVQTAGAAAVQAQAQQLELEMTEQGGTLKTAVFSGNVHAETTGAQPMQGNAGRVVLDFSRRDVLTKVRAEENVKLLQHQPPSAASASGQDLELTAPVVDFLLTSRRRLDRAETAGAAQITLRSSAPDSGRPNTERPDNGKLTVVMAGKFEAHFDDSGQFSSIHGAPDARIVSQNPGQPDRISTSRTLDATFHPGSGIEAVEQQGIVAYEDGDRKAWGDRARYTPADQILVLTGSPRVVEGGMTTTARTMRLNRATGDAIADGDVKSTYSDLKLQPNGALLSSSSPIHVTASSMTVHGASAIALYAGDARLWQDANIVEAPSIEFDRNQRGVSARGSPPQTVSTVLVQTDQNGKSTPIAITSARLSYTDNERKAHFEGDVAAKGGDLTITAHQMDAFLAARGQAAANQPASGPARLDKIVAAGQVTITQPNRQATGDQLVYTAAGGKFVLTGGPPSIFDAEHGKITGVSLTFFRRDDRVLVEGNNSSPTVTQTQVAR